MGRWWSLWGASDLVPMRKVVCQVAPTLFVPVKAATTEQVVTGRDSGVVQKASAYASPGQPVRGVRLLVSVACGLLGVTLGFLGGYLGAFYVPLEIARRTLHVARINQ